MTRQNENDNKCQDRINYLKRRRIQYGFAIVRNTWIKTDITVLNQVMSQNFGSPDLPQLCDSLMIFVKFD